MRAQAEGGLKVESGSHLADVEENYDLVQGGRGRQQLLEYLGQALQGVCVIHSQAWKPRYSHSR